MCERIGLRGFWLLWMRAGILFLLLTCHIVRAAETGRILRYSLKEGLSFGIVNSIVQDTTGLMWFGTGDGLNRFDGTSFKVFKHDPNDPQSISGNYIKAVFRDRDGGIWTTSRNGINEYLAEKEAFRRHAPRPAKNGLPSDVSDIAQARDGNLWLSLNGAGIALFNKKTAQFTYYNQSTLPDLRTNSILNTFEDSHGLLWLGSRESGVDVFQVGRNRRLTKARIDLSSIPKTRINQIFEDHLHNVWIASASGLIVYTRSDGKFYNLRIPNLRQSEIYLSLRENRQQKLLVGVQDGGIYSIDLAKFKGRNPAEFTFEKVANAQNEGITQRSVQAIYVDRDANTWLGTYGEGIYLISSIAEKFRNFEKKIRDYRAESYLRYYGMCADENGDLWLGSDGDGIYKTKNTGELIKHYAVDGKPGSLTDGAIIAALGDRDNNLWFGSYSKGLFLYNRETDSFQNYSNRSNDPQSLGRNDVRVIFEDSKRNIWIGTNGGGLARFDRKTEKFKNYIPSNSSINSNDVRAIAEDQKGNLWIGTYGGGLNYLDVASGQFTSFFNDPKKPDFLSNHIVFSLLFDAKQRLWIGSEGNGLLMYDTVKKTTRRYHEKNGLPNDVINAILAETPDKIWLSTNEGISSIDLIHNKIKNYDQSNGLQAGQFNPNSALYDPKTGIMCFGGTEGWSLFYPKLIKPSPYRPKVMITGLQLFDTNVEVGAEIDGNTILSRSLADQNKIVLQPKQSVFSIQYTSLNYSFPERNSFAYKLEGLDERWNYVENERSATYRYLPAGTYHFKVKAANQDAIWFENAAELEIHILPPWYQTWWAYLLYIGAVVALIYSYQLYKLRQAKLKYEIQLAHMETQKEKELNEKKLQFFTNISHEFRTPLTLIINPVRALLKDQGRQSEGNLEIVYRNAKRLLSLVDQLLLFRKADLKADKLKLATYNLRELAFEVFQCFIHQAEEKHITYAFLCKNEELFLNCDREKLEIALFNLVSNALKFTPQNGKVSLELTDNEDEVQILVKDSGPGIPPEASEQIFKVFHQFKSGRSASKGGFGIGLFLTKTFIESHFGELTYESVLDKGTVFNIKLPKNHPLLVPEFEPEGVAAGSSVFLEELSGNYTVPAPAVKSRQQIVVDELSSGEKTMLIVDDDADIRQYIGQIFKDKFKLLQADNAEEGIVLARKHIPDIIICDVMMSGMSGIEMCRLIKSDLSVSHIPVILLTASTSQQVRLQGIEGGADDYISKPFDQELLVARVTAILKNRNDLQRYFYNEITLQANDFKISSEYKDFLKNCIQIVESHLTDPGFTIKVLAAEIGMSHSTLYNRIKSISGQSTNSFIRFIRLRRAAQILITTDITISEVAYQVGINDIKYFRENFYKLFGMKPSEYVKKFRRPFHENFQVDKGIFQNKLDN
ncbi:two-component regulator propeller domain-containing protein [Dyadobacter sp. CY343]|uniref:two-component regulator propeller domain-containing protein n=1 Tax=Dyadobacter sp. CY343 TaxID=2907299 RepID=UPI001F28E637|nr:two-component regulator propeller domain-containing protein [Dyadobacter sp. CY343]MCE7062000.1 response regulator [Dyadobacter sp. CY343]